LPSCLIHPCKPHQKFTTNLVTNLTCVFETIDCFIRMCARITPRGQIFAKVCVVGVACALNLAAPGGCVRWPRERSGARVALGARAARCARTAPRSIAAPHSSHNPRYPICVRSLHSLVARSTAAEKYK